tara:strand:- start:1909 stop:2292 length:384 start_codon:yes stop_codon:yes gene_type:complete
MYGISPKLPIKVGKVGTPISTLTIAENTQQNLKNLLLTSPGERVMDSNFGVGLRMYLFQNNTPTNRARLESRIVEQVTKYLPFVRITSLNIAAVEDRNELSIELRYDIQNIKIGEILSLSLDPKLTT